MALYPYGLCACHCVNNEELKLFIFLYFLVFKYWIMDHASLDINPYLLLSFLPSKYEIHSFKSINYNFF